MSGWDANTNANAEHEPSEESGRAAWGGQAPLPVTPPPWATAQTQTFSTPLPGHPPAPAPAPAPPPYPTAPVPGPQPAAPVPPSPASPHRLLLVLTVAAVLGAGVGFGVWFVVRDDSRTTGATVSPPASVTATPAVTVTPAVTATTIPSAATLSSPSPYPTPTPTASPSAGYRRAQDPVGYALVVPEGWTRRQKQGEKAPVVFYDSPDDDRSLQIFALVEDSPGESLDLAENDPGYGFAQQPGYQVLDRTSDGTGDTWSEVSYRYDDEDKGPRQVIDHRFRAADGTLFAIRSSGPEDLDPDLVRAPLDTALDSFCPADGSCT